MYYYWENNQKTIQKKKNDREKRTTHEIVEKKIEIERYELTNLYIKKMITFRSAIAYRNQ